MSDDLGTPIDEVLDRPPPDSDPSGSRKSSNWKATLAIVLLVAGALGVGFGRYVYHDIHESSLRKNGVHVQGHVVSVKDTGDRINDDPVADVTVEFAAADGAIVRGTTIERVSTIDAPRLVPGAGVRVWYDPAKPTDIAIGWREDD